MSNPRKSKEQKIIEGTFRKDRDPQNVPKVDALGNIPAPPPCLGKIAKAAWMAIASKLVKNKILSELDLESLEMLCVNIGIYRECLAAIQGEGIAVYMSQRNSQTALELTAMNKAMQMVKQLSGLFGLSPSDRAKLGVIPEPPESPEEKEQRLKDEAMEALLK